MTASGAATAGRSLRWRRLLSQALLAVAAFGAYSVAAPAADVNAPTKRVTVQPYFNKIFECRFPHGWTLETTPEPLRKTKTKLTVARRPGSSAMMSVQFFSYQHPKFPTVQAYLKANAAGAKVTRKKLFKNRKTRFWRYERKLPGGVRERVVIRKLTKKGSYCVFRFYADNAAFDKDRKSFGWLLKSFRYRLPSSRKRERAQKAPASGSKSGKRLRPTNRIFPRGPDKR